MNQNKTEDETVETTHNDSLEHDEATDEQKQMQSWQQRTVNFLKKYFLQGQKMEENVVAAKDPDANFFQRNRKLLSVVVPATVVYIVWWSIAISKNYFHYFTATTGTKGAPNWVMSVTMIFGSFIAGSTPAGGGAVAFPVMTLALGVAPFIARDYTFMIQGVGMTCAAVTILIMRVKLEWHSLVYVTIGGLIGIIVGLEQIAPRLPPAYSKMYFVVIWVSFAVGLYMLNRHRDREVYGEIQNLEEGVLFSTPGRMGKYFFFNWKLAVLFIVGITGGVFSAVSGSGIDICSFSILTLLFRMDEKVATPTSVILMAINTLIGFAYREFAHGGVSEEAWPLFFVSVPIVVIGAPIGSFVGSYVHRLTLAALVYLIDIVQLVGALAIVQPWTTKNTDTPILLTTTSVVIFFGAIAFFLLISYAGLQLVQKSEHADKAQNIQIRNGTKAGTVEMLEEGRCPVFVIDSE